MESEIRLLRRNLGTNGSDAADPASSASKASDRTESPERASVKDTSYSITAVNGEEAPDPYGLTSNDLRAPVTAMHAMTPESMQQQESTRGRLPSSSNPSPPVLKAGDFISEGFLNEAQARALFNM